MFKVAYYILLPNLCLSFKYINETPVYITRNAISNNFVLPAPRNNVLKRNLLYQGPNLYNNIPLHIKLTESINVFKTILQAICCKQVGFSLFVGL